MAGKRNNKVILKDRFYSAAFFTFNLLFIPLIPFLFVFFFVWERVEEFLEKRGTKSGGKYGLLGWY